MSSVKKDFLPRKVVPDSSESGKAIARARNDVYGSLHKGQKTSIDSLIDKRDKKVKEVEDAESDITRALKSANELKNSKPIPLGD